MNENLRIDDVNEWTVLANALEALMDGMVEDDEDMPVIVGLIRKLDDMREGRSAS
jgi:hypothetical protein